MPRWWYLFPLILSSVAIILAVWTTEQGQRVASDAILRGDLPGSFELQADAGGVWLLFNEVTTWRDGKLAESGTQEGFLVRAKDPSNRIIELKAPPRAYGYEINGTKGLAFASFEIEGPTRLTIEGFYQEGAGDETVAITAVPEISMPRLSVPTWQWPIALFTVFICIVLAAVICRSRIRRLVDYESRAVPTMSSTTMPAPLWRRTFATIIDLVLFVIVLMGLSPILAPLVENLLASQSVTARLVVPFAAAFVFLAYYIIPEAVLGGTLGKFVMSLRTVTAEGRRLGFERAIVRNLVRAIDLFPFCYLAGAISQFFSKHNRRLGDHAADTMVVIR